MKKEVKKELDNILKKYKWKNVDEIDWEYVCENRNLSENFIKEFANKIDWFWLCEYQYIPKYLLREYKDKLHLHYMVENNIISYEFYKKLTYIKPLTRYELLDFS